MTTGIALLGSTGSIGTQTLAVVDYYPDKFDIISLAAKTNCKLLEKQIIKYKPKVVVIENEEAGIYLKNKFANQPVQIYIGNKHLSEAVIHQETDIVVTALSGIVGLLPTLDAIKAGKKIALANKETLVAAGDLVMEAIKKYDTSLIPVDSEHSAIFQCLQGNELKEVNNLILTASGGPFKGYTKTELKKVSVKAALNHPNWEMGSKITIDSATMMNKGLEVIEAKHLFNIDYDQIQVLIHPQSIIHSMVEYVDGSIIAQMGFPSMQIPIQYALTYPARWPGSFAKKLDFANLGELTFEETNNRLFPALELAIKAGKIGGTMPAVLNGANEIAVDKFLKKEISFLSIIETVEKVMEKHQVIKEPSLEDILNADLEARERVNYILLN